MTPSDDAPVRTLPPWWAVLLVVIAVVHLPLPVVTAIALLVGLITEG